MHQRSAFVNFLIRGIRVNPWLSFLPSTDDALWRILPVHFGTVIAKHATCHCAISQTGLNLNEGSFGRANVTQVIAGHDVAP
jgi:hypothetical protein